LPVDSSPFFYVQTVDREKIFLMVDVLRINGIEITFAKRQVMNGIEQIGFSGAVSSNETIDLIGKVKICFAVVLEICDAQVFEVHGLVFCDAVMLWLVAGYLLWVIQLSFGCHTVVEGYRFTRPNVPFGTGGKFQVQGSKIRMAWLMLLASCLLILGSCLLILVSCVLIL
jgi:hypothetical protein